MRRGCVLVSWVLVGAIIIIVSSRADCLAVIRLDVDRVAVREADGEVMGGESRVMTPSRPPPVRCAAPRSLVSWLLSDAPEQEGHTEQSLEPDRSVTLLQGEWVNAHKAHRAFAHTDARRGREEEEFNVGRVLAIWF